MAMVEVNLKEWIVICAKLAAVEGFIDNVKEIQADKERDDWDKGRDIGRLVKGLDLDFTHLKDNVERCLDEA